MRISDWSSDVCSSDLAQKAVHAAGFHPTAILGCLGAAAGVAAAMGQNRTQIRDTLGVAGSMASGIIEYLADGTWTDRKSVGSGMSVSVRVDLGGSRLIKKKKKLSTT